MNSLAPLMEGSVLIAVEGMPVFVPTEIPRPEIDFSKILATCQLPSLCGRQPAIRRRLSR